VSEKDLGEQIEMTFLTASLNGFARWYLHFGNYADIVSPKALKDLVKEAIVAIDKRLRRS
jgi:predicted DNA-binding transcriptional regulator YafY